MARNLPTLILTGASGIVGRGFLAAAQDRFRIYAIARRPQHRAGVPNHPNIEWIQVDIANAEALSKVTAQIQLQGGADYLIHLAAYYDFVNEDRPEFQATNVDGTRNILAVAEELAVKRFIFASSVAACKFPAPGGSIVEQSPPDADFPYARSKREGESMVWECSQRFPCSVVRLAAVVSDWCEYAPLYIFLSTWLSGRWNARILGGKGLSAVPYIHSRDVNRLFLTVLERSSSLPPFAVYQASPDGATSQVELFELATRFHSGESASPVLMPALLAAPGMLVRDLFGRLIGKRPFERLWMLRYLDRALTIDSSGTRAALGWAPTPRLHILRRLPFMIAKMKGEPHEWTFRNQRAMRRPPARPTLVIHDAMVEARNAIVDAITAYLQSPVRQQRFPGYALIPADELRWYINIVYELLAAAVRTADRSLLLDYIRDIARLRFEGGFPPAEVCDALLAINQVIVEELLHKPAVAGLSQQLRDSVTLSIALAIDGVQDAYEELGESAPDTNGSALVESEQQLEAIVGQLNAFYQPPRADGRKEAKRALRGDR
jgi:nucleoside-diphosphate-sugar epimerase